MIVAEGAVKTKERGLAIEAPGTERAKSSCGQDQVLPSGVPLPRWDAACRAFTGENEDPPEAVYLFSHICAGPKFGGAGGLEWAWS